MARPRSAGPKTTLPCCARRKCWRPSSEGRRRGASRRPFLWRRGGAGRGHAQACPDRQPDSARSADTFAAAPMRRGRALPLLPRHDGCLFRRLARRRPGGDPVDDRFLRRRGNLGVMAGSRARLRRRDDAGQHARLGLRLRSPAVAGNAGGYRRAGLRGRRGAEPSRDLPRQRPRRHVDRWRDIQDDRWRGAFHDLDPSGAGCRTDRRYGLARRRCRTPVRQPRRQQTVAQADGAPCCQ